MAKRKGSLNFDEVFHFGVRCSGKKAILRVDFPERMIQLIHRGDLKKSMNFRQYVDFEFDKNICLTISFHDDVKIKADIIDQEDKKILDYILKVIISLVRKRSGSVDFSGFVLKIFEGSRPFYLPSQGIIKEGIVEKKGNSTFPKWEKRLLQIRTSEIAYYKVGSSLPLNVSRVWREDCVIDKQDKLGFTISVQNASGRTFCFRIVAGHTPTKKDVDEQQEWVQALRSALVYKSSILKPTDSLDEEDT